MNTTQFSKSKLVVTKYCREFTPITNINNVRGYIYIRKYPILANYLGCSISIPLIQIPIEWKKNPIINYHLSYSHSFTYTFAWSICQAFGHFLAQPNCICCVEYNEPWWYSTQLSLLNGRPSRCDSDDIVVYWPLTFLVWNLAPRHEPLLKKELGPALMYNVSL